MNVTLWGKRIIMAVTLIGIVSMAALVVVKFGELYHIWYNMPFWR
jgi:hypothetical protein